MIELVKGNLLNADAEALVNTVNIQGVMGKGIALQFKRAFPDNYKVHWRSPSRYEYIESGLQALVNEIKDRAIQSIAIPPLGAGLGGLEWPKVRLLIEHALGEIENITVYLYEPSGAPNPENRVNRTQ